MIAERNVHRIGETADIIEGFPLRFGISEFVAVDPAGSIPLESYRQESIEEAAQARRMFETFMTERGIPRSGGASAGVR